MEIPKFIVFGFIQIGIKTKFADSIADEFLLDCE